MHVWRWCRGPKWVLFLLRGSSASRRVVAGQSSCRWSTDIKLGSNLWLLAPHEHSTAHICKSSSGFCAPTIARAARAEPSRDVYAAAKPFQTNKLLGYPGRRPDAAQRPPIQDTALPLPSLEDISSGRTIHPSRARRRTRRLPSQVRRTLPVVRSLLLVVRTLPPWKAEGRV